MKNVPTHLLLLGIGISITLLIPPKTVVAQTLTFDDIKDLQASGADHRIAYGIDPLQFGDLRLPKSGPAPYPVVVVIHGGCWYSEYDLNYMASLCNSLRTEGIATWNLEYRRIGDSGGGWPGTFQDVAHGTDYLRTLARKYPLDLKRVVVLGHSAGGQLALWLAARRHLRRSSSLYSPKPLRLRGVVSLSGILALRSYRPNCGNAVSKLLGGSPDEVAVRYEQTSPIEMLPLKVPQRLVHGNRDVIVPLNQSQSYEAAARKRGDDAELKIVEGAGHFEMVAPKSLAWPAVDAAVYSLLKPHPIR